MENEISNLKEHITDKFKAHEDLEAVRHAIQRFTQWHNYMERPCG